MPKPTAKKATKRPTAAAAPPSCLRVPTFLGVHTLALPLRAVAHAHVRACSVREVVGGGGARASAAAPPPARARAPRLSLIHISQPPRKAEISRAVSSL